MNWRRRRGLAILLSAGLAILVGRVLSGAEFFVAQGGSDDSDGRSEKTSFATVGKGVSVLEPGDVLTILPGTYFEAVSARISGKPAAPITIRAKRPGTALLRGDVDAPHFRRADGMRCTYWTQFKPRVEGIAERSTRRIYEPMLSVAEVEQSLASFYQDAQTGRLYVHTSDSANPDWHALSLSVTNGFGILLTEPPGARSVHDVIIDGLSFTGYQSREFPSGPGSHSRWGLHIVSPERIVVRRCVSFLNGGGVYVLAGEGSVVEDCYAFGNFSRFQALGNNILGWSVSDTVFRRNRVECFWEAPVSSGDITFYGGARVDKKPTRGVMEANLAVNAGLMIKGSYGDDTLQRRNVVVGRGAYFYRPPDATNLLLPNHESDVAKRTYADPVNHDYRLQSDAPIRGMGPGGQDPGPRPYRDEVFFVSPTGDDAAEGTSLKRAWRTLSHAAKQAQPGHTVYITAGEYRESLAPQQSGTADKPIRFLRRGRDRVVLDGQGRLPVGLDLTGRAHVAVKGLLVRDFTQYGVLALGGADLHIEQVVVSGSGTDGVMVSAVSGLVFAHNLVRSSQGAGLRLENSPGALVTGNLFDMGGGPHIACDEASRKELWSDGNAFSPGNGGGPSMVVGDRQVSLEAWRKVLGLDPTSLVAAPGYLDPIPERCDFALRPDSPLIGRGPHASTIGPYLRIMVRRGPAIEDLRVHDTSDTTATVEWWTPTKSVTAALQYGDTPDCLNKIRAPVGVFHTASIIGLEPGTKYWFRAASEGQDEVLRFAPYEPVQAAVSDVSVRIEPQSFQTAARRAPPRELHVAISGDDTRSGLSAAEAWRTIGRAAQETRAGDTVIIHGGNYEECVVVRSSGCQDAPITFRAAPGEIVWMEGSERFRSTALRLAVKHHIHIDGIHFRHFRYVPHAGDVINISGGSHHVVRRCFYDGRETGGYMANFIRAADTANLLVDNCVMVNGMGEGLVLSNCVDPVVRHCVFYNNFIRAMTLWQRSPQGALTLSHNLFCDTIPEKTGNPLIRISELNVLRSDHNGYFTRVGPDKRHVVEALNIGGKAVGYQGPGQYYGRKLLLEEVQTLTGQDRNSRFGNPGMKVVRELLPSGAREGQWLNVEMHFDGKAFGAWDFADFLAHPAGPLGRAADGKPIGLDPTAFAGRSK